MICLTCDSYSGQCRMRFMPTMICVAGRDREDLQDNRSAWQNDTRTIRRQHRPCSRKQPETIRDRCCFALQEDTDTICRLRLAASGTYRCDPHSQNITWREDTSVTSPGMLFQRHARFPQAYRLSFHLCGDSCRRLVPEMIKAQARSAWQPGTCDDCTTAPFV